MSVIVRRPCGDDWYNRPPALRVRIPPFGLIYGDSHEDVQTIQQSSADALPNAQHRDTQSVRRRHNISLHRPPSTGRTVQQLVLQRTTCEVTRP